MEWIDIYDSQGRRTGEVREKDAPVAEGEYRLAVGIWILDSAGRIFLTRRAPEKRYAPGKWENTSGHVQAGEDPADAVLRELLEETGVTVDRDGIVFLGGATAWPYLGKNYGARASFPAGAARLQPGETDAARWVSFEEFRRMAAQGDLAPSLLKHLAGYREAFLRFVGHPGAAL